MNEYRVEPIADLLHVDELVVNLVVQIIDSNLDILVNHVSPGLTQNTCFLLTLNFCF